MSSLNLSTNGPSITKSYQSVLNSPPPTGPAASSPTYGQWAVFTVAAPLVSAFQNDGGKESVMKVQSTGEGELIDFIEEFSDGRIQFGFLKVKDPNTTLQKCVLVGWCGEGVPERTKGYFTSHLNAVAKLLQGYHVQITARSDRDLTPEAIVQKIADASGSKYSGGGSIPKSDGPPPPISSKPVFTPTISGSGGSGFNPLGARARAAPSSGPVDNDGWGADAPQVTRTQLEKVPSAYQPTRVVLSELTAKQQEQSRSSPQTSDAPGVVRGAYQPIGKVDIAEIRRQAQQSGSSQDNRPTVVKGAYEPVGKVDIAAIRARAQPPPVQSIPEPADDDEAPKSLADRSAAFQQSERLTSLPKPKVASKFGGASAFSGTRAPVPVGFTPKTNPSAAPVGIASRTFADQGGKTPAQLWAEKKARQGGGVVSPTTTGSDTSRPVVPQTSGDGGWKSSYSGKSWAPVQTTRTGQSVGSDQQPAEDLEEEQEPAVGGVGSIRDRFAAAPPPMNIGGRPNAGARAVPETPEEEEEEEYGRPSSPIRVAMPVGRGHEPEPEEEEPPALPVASLSRAAAGARNVPPEPKLTEDEPARGAGIAVAESSFGPGASAAHPGASKSGKRALIQYDYEKAEDNEIELKEGEYVSNIEMVDADWWMGQNSAGETGLFPANYVEIVEEEEEAPAPHAAAAASHAPPAAAAAPSGGAKKPTATAQYDYEAAEDNELSFPDGAKVINLEFPDDDWWLGEYNGKTGLFPANYVQLDE